METCNYLGNVNEASLWKSYGDVFIQNSDSYTSDGLKEFIAKEINAKNLD